MKIETEDLISVNNYAKKVKTRKGTAQQPSRIYQMIHTGRLDAVVIDGIYFVHKEAKIKQ